ncbi:MAG TPA: hypothetical protein VF158_12460 [Longimicrobiales bacterium]
MADDGTPLRALALGRALGWYADGLAEDPPGSNWGPRVRGILADTGITVPAPWCAAFVYSCAQDVARLHGLPNPLEHVVRRALVADYYAIAKERGWLIEPERADRGDLVIYDFAGGHRWDHIGYVETPPGWSLTFRALEGNTNDAGGREGVEVAIRDRRIEPGRVVFARWDEGVEYVRRAA